MASPPQIVLSVSHDDYLVLKCAIAASVAKTSLVVKKGLTQEALVALHADAKSMVLQTRESSVITQHLAILRYLADVTPAAQLLGTSAFDVSQVEQWLHFTWQQLEVPLQLLLAVASGDPAFLLGEQDKPAVLAQARSDIAEAISQVENRLTGRVYIAASTLTIADISLFATCTQLHKLDLFSAETYPVAAKWFSDVASLPDVKSVANVTLAVKAPAAAPAAVAALPPAPPAAASSSSSAASPFAGKWKRCRVRVKELLAQGESVIGTEVTVKGWVRTSRAAENNTLLFVDLTDGSTVKGLQLVLSDKTTQGFASIKNCGGVGASISCTGTVVASPAKGQTIEMHVLSAECLGPVYGGDKPGEIGGKNYPMAKKAHSLEYLREKAHLRIRSKMFSSAMRMRHAMAFATHKFFNERGFVYTHTPLITGADCEGAGEQFVVTTLLPDHAKGKDIPLDKAGNVDFSKDFFGRRCCMTVSGQLNLETHAHGLSDVYTFGPTFRAENSHTARHLAEFWMIEPEICFAELADDMALAEDYVKYCTSYALEHCQDDLNYFENEYPAGEKGLRARLENVASSDFARITYTEAVDLLQKEIADKKVKFERYPNWGDDLGSEHERYITEQIYRKPTIVINYPKEIKAFYMKLNPDDKTVAAMDILVPKIGELIGGSQREDNLEILQSRAAAVGMKPEDIWWYADLRKYGSVPHAGFGLGFERLVMFVTGLENIRDVIPFPRVPGHAEF